MRVTIEHMFEQNFFRFSPSIAKCCGKLSGIADTPKETGKMATYTITYKAKRAARFGRFKYSIEQVSVCVRYKHNSEFGVVNYSREVARDDAFRKGMCFMELRGVAVA